MIPSTLITNHEKEVLPIAKAFEQKVNENGFELRSTEGMAYIGESGAFISQNITPFLIDWFRL